MRRLRSKQVGIEKVTSFDVVMREYKLRGDELMTLRIGEGAISVELFSPKRTLNKRNNERRFSKH